MKCPHCNGNIDVQFIKAPANSGSTSPKAEAATGDLGELLDMIDDNSLEGAAVDFVAQTKERFAKYKDKTRMSPKQMDWLRKLAGVETEEKWD